MFTILDFAALGVNLSQSDYAKALDKLLDRYVQQHPTVQEPTKKLVKVIEEKGFSSCKIREEYESAIPDLMAGIGSTFSPFATSCIQQLASQLSNSNGPDHAIDVGVEYWKRAAAQKLGRFRSRQLFDVLWKSKSTEWVEEMYSWGQADLAARLQDLKPFIEAPIGRTYLSDEFIAQAMHKLLHPAASTIDILEVYMRTIEYFQKLDPTRVLIHRMTGPFKAVLNSRDETVGIILTSMLNSAIDEHEHLIESHDDYCAPIAQMVAIYLNQRFEEYFDGMDLHNLDWQPEPLDARPGYRRSAHLDAMAHLVGLQSPDIFIKELQHVLAQRFLTSEHLNFQREAELIEMFKSRFEQIHIQQCEIMLRDVVESKKVDKDIHLRETKLPSAEEPNFVELGDIQVKVLSRFYWPPLKDEAFEFPHVMKDIAERYENRWRAIKKGRRLEWLKALGHVTVELELHDRTVTETVTTLQAAVIHEFNNATGPQGLLSDPVTRTVYQITEKLKLEESLARAALTFWVGKLVLLESSTIADTFTVLETLSDKSASSIEEVNRAAAAAAAAQQADTAAAGSGLKSETDVLKENFDLYARFVEGMLTNQGAMPASRIKLMLNMLVPGGFPFEEADLVGLLNELAEESRIERTGPLWRIVKQ